MSELHSPHLYVPVLPATALVENGHDWIDALRSGWHVVHHWGAGAWPLGGVPRVIVIHLDDPEHGVYAVALYDVRDLELRAFTTRGERDAATDQIAAEHWRRTGSGPPDLPPEGEPLPHHKGAPVRGARAPVPRASGGAMASNQLTTLCATCGERVVAIERTEGAERRWELRHWTGSDHDHEPARATVPAHDTSMWCDFCGSPEPEWMFQASYAVRTISYSEHDVVAHETSEPWAACAPCKRDVLQRDVDRVLHRRMTRERMEGLGEDPFVRDVLAEEALHNWNAFVDSQPDEPYRFVEWPLGG